MSNSYDHDSKTVAVADEDDKANTRGIPGAPFIEDVEEYVTKQNKDIDTVLKDLHMLYGKYKFMESQLVSQKRNMLQKIPEIESALTALRRLLKRPDDDEPELVHYELTDAIWAQAKVKRTETCFLWLGANVMLEYPLAEAEQLLTRNLGNARVTLADLTKDLEFLKDQITISEVNIARVHNHRIKLKKEAEKSSGGGAPRAIEAQS
jgi:prefoldin subunit 5